jgi:ABC-type taurine transport system substrate-binding protein
MPELTVKYSLLQAVVQEAIHLGRIIWVALNPLAFFIAYSPGNIGAASIIT